MRVLAILLVLAGSARADGWIEAGGAPGHPVLLVRGAHAAVALELRGTVVVPLWRGSVGPQGADGEWRRQIALEPTGLSTWEERDDVSDCDGVAARLFVKRFDFAAGEFKDGTDSQSATAGALPLTATRGGAPNGFTASTAPTVFRFRSATRSTGDGGNAEGLSTPSELDDGDLGTAWSGPRGTTFVARADSAESRVVAIRIVPGNALSSSAFASEDRVRRLIVGIGHESFVVDIPRDPAADGKGFASPYWVSLPAPVSAACVSVTLDATYAGRAAGRAAIAELAVLTELDGAGVDALAALAEEIAHGGAGAVDIERRLAGRGPAGAAALVAAAAKPRGEDERARLRLALARLGDPQGAHEVVLGLRAASDGADAAHFGEGLRQMGNAAVPELARLLADDEVPVAARITAAQILAAVPTPDADAALDGACGHGPRELRRAIVIALANRDTGALAALVAAARGAHDSGARESDLWQAVGFAARRAPTAARTAATLAVVARLADAHTYELRYRLVQAAAGLVIEESARAAITAFLASEPEPALREVAVEALPAEPEAKSILVIAAADADPGVRAAALADLAPLADASDTDASILGALAGDAWTEVRRAAAETLSPRCARAPVAEGLYGAVKQDHDENVKRTALAALVRCKEPRVGVELLAIAADRRISGDLRAYAATLIGALGDRAQVDAVVSLLQDQRTLAPLSDESLRVAAAAAHSLGELGDPRVGPLLEEIALDPALPVLEASAVSALGKICPPGGHGTLTHSAQAGDALVARAARLALRQCKQ